MRFFYLILLSVAATSFFITNLFLAATIYKYIQIFPTFSISEAPTYTGKTFDPSKVKVLPGSLAIFVSKDSPFFTYLTQDVNVYSIVGLYALAGSLVALILAIAFMIKEKTTQSAILSGVLFGLSAALFGLAILFLAPAKQGDLICYKPPVENSPVICHTLVEVKNDTVVLIRHYDNQTEEVPKEWVIGKIVLIVPPPYGALLYTLRATINLFVTLYSLIIQGQIPVSLKIEYIKVL